MMAPVVLPGDDMRLYQRGGTYWLDYGETKGRRVRISLKTTDERLAREALIRAQAEAIEDRAGLLRRVLARSRGITWEQAVEEFRAWSLGNHTESTRVRYSSVLRLHFGVFAGPLGAIDRPKIQRYVAQRLAEGAQPRALQTELALLSGILRQQVEAHRLPANPASGVKVKVHPRPERFLAREEVMSIVDAAREPVATAIELVYHTGLRRNELLHFRWDRVDLEDNWLHVTSSRGQAWAPKGGKSRDIPVNSRAHALLQAQAYRTKAFSQYVFARPDGSRRVNIYKEWRRALSEAGFVGDNSVRIHDLRHAWASECVKRGVDLRTLQEWGGWSNLDMVQKYSHVDPKHHHEAAERLVTPAQKRHNGLASVTHLPR